MHPLLRYLSLFLLALLSFAQKAHAAHSVGGSLTYTSLGNNQYLVRCDFFRDCSGIAPPVSFSLRCAPTCTSPSTAVVTATLSQVGQPVIGAPYSSSVQPTASCPIGGCQFACPINFATYHYEATVMLPPNSWILSVEEAGRPAVANLTTPATLRLEATLDNTVVPNTSVRFSAHPIFLVPNQQDNLLHIGAFDADGDSLSYQLARPLSGCGSYETYAPAQIFCSGLVNGQTFCLVDCSYFMSLTRNGLYSTKVPIAVKLDTVGSCPLRTAVPRFAFDSLSGALAFQPNRYLNTNTANGDNKYAVVVKVTEWRKLNGVYTVVGTTRRDMMWVVYDGSTAALPRLSPTVMVQSGTRPSIPQALASPILVRVGEPIDVRFTATSPLANNPLTFTLEQNTIPGAVIQNAATPNTATLTFTPPLSLRDGLYRVSLTVKDDASPLRNLITVPVTFRVYSGMLASRGARSQSALAAYPNPFSERVQFQLASSGVQPLTVYNQLGQVVAHLQSQADGQVQWQPGAELPAGLYLARTADGSQHVRLLRTQAR